MLRGKDVQRDFRDLRHAIQDLLNADWNLYQPRVEGLMATIKNSSTLSLIITPYLEIPLDRSQIEVQSANYWVELNLPTDKDQRIAYVLQTLKEYSVGGLDPIRHTHLVFHNKTYNENIRKYNQQIVAPALRDLLDKISDLEEDEIAGHENNEIPPTVLNIFNYGHLQAGRDLAFGQHIQQNSQQYSFVDELSILLQQEGIPFDKVSEVRPILKEIETELQQETVNQSKLKCILAKLVDIGGAIVANIVASSITNPQAAATVMEIIKTLV